MGFPPADDEEEDIMRRTIAKFSLVAALAAGVTGCGMIGGSEGAEEPGQTEQGQDSPADSDQDGPSDGGAAEDAETADGNGSDDENDTGSGSEASDAGGGQDSGASAAGDESASVTSVSGAETLAENSIELGGTTLLFELKSVSSGEGGMVVQGILSNTGEADVSLSGEFHDIELVPEGVSSVGSASQLNLLLVTDPTTGNVHSPGYLADGTCLCTDSGSSQFKAGETMVVNTQYAALPADVEAVTVSFGQLGSFENVPVTQS